MEMIGVAGDLSINDADFRSKVNFSLNRKPAGAEVQGSVPFMFTAGRNMSFNHIAMTLFSNEAYGQLLAKQ